MSPKLYDVLIIGGGPAGLSMAIALARQAYSALVLDSGEYRNARATHMHNVPGFDHVNPVDFRTKVCEDLRKRYEHIEFKAATIKEVRKLDSGIFEAIDDQGDKYTGKKLGLGTGVRDVPPADIEGYDACWARGVFHCLFCHGFEERGAESVGVLASGMLTAAEMIAHATLMAKRLAKSTTVYTNGNPSLLEQVRSMLHSSKITYEDRKVARLELENGSGPSVIVHFTDGTSKREGFITNHPLVEQQSPFAAQLGLECAPTGDIVVTAPFNETSVKGCFAAGDAATMMKSAVQAIQMGMFAGVGLVSQLHHDLDEKDEL
ncbi:Thioredoxin reductase gliT [Metarhizium brunneum]|uniref:Thioredoxin reductase gliT n=1 Tax=Metarhizium brunneum TaxID=500148 RepID=A0A7D5UR91_9HYPO|nr:Thioredoxin reductase gliT [Metarhizium brunneum]